MLFVGTYLLGDITINATKIPKDYDTVESAYLAHIKMLQKRQRFMETLLFALWGFASLMLIYLLPYIPENYMSRVEYY